MRSKSRFMTLVLLETLDPCAIALYASWPLSPGATQHRYQAGANPYSDRSSTAWIAPACLAHSFDHLVGAGEQRLRGGDARPFCGCRGARRGHEDAQHEQQVPLEGPPLY